MIAVSQWRFEVIQGALKHPSKSIQRSEEIERAASSIRTWPSGKRDRVSARTIHRWIDAYERAGIAGLMPVTRGDRGRRRVMITRDWDAAVPFDDETKAAIQSEFERYIRSLWASNDTFGWKRVAKLAKSRLMKLTLDAGFDPGRVVLRRVCRLPRNVVEKGREYRAVAIHDKDKKRYFDESMPRIRRTAKNLDPMEIVVADVHHLDVLLPRPDGRTFTPKSISFLDMATNRVFCHLVFLPKREGVRQEHVIEAYITLISHPHWGVPQFLYLDNGGEFNTLALIDGAQKLNTEIRKFDRARGSAKVSDSRRSSIVNAQPYNAPAKRVEPFFKIFEHGFLSSLPGYVGGDRMKSKTANVGKAPVPYRSGESNFRRDVATLLEAYETQPQDGELGGLSPREKFAQFVDAGWRRMDARSDAVRAVFAHNKMRTVKRGAFKFNGETYTSREIQRLPAGTNVVARVPIVFDGEEIPVLTAEGQFLCVARRDRPYDILETAGAHEAGARRRENTDGIRDMRADIDRLDMIEEERRALEFEEPSPTPESAGVVSTGDVLARIGREMSLPPATRTEREAARNKKLAEERDDFARKFSRMDEFYQKNRKAI